MCAATGERRHAGSPQAAALPAVPKAPNATSRAHLVRGAVARVQQQIEGAGRAGRARKLHAAQLRQRDQQRRLRAGAPVSAVNGMPLTAWHAADCCQWRHARKPGRTAQDDGKALRGWFGACSLHRPPLPRSRTSSGMVLTGQDSPGHASGRPGWRVWSPSPALDLQQRFKRDGGGPARGRAPAPGSRWRWPWGRASPGSPANTDRTPER